MRVNSGAAEDVSEESFDSGSGNGPSAAVAASDNPGWWTGVDSAKIPRSASETQDARPRVLMSAFTCDPDSGSEPGVGWRWACEAARSVDVWVMTRELYRDAITSAERQAPSGVNWVFLDVPRWTLAWGITRHWRPLFEMAYWLTHRLWQRKAYLIARTLDATVKFDIVHHVTFGSCLTATYLDRLGIPFVWGPLGGAERTPPSFLASYDARAKFHDAVRSARILILKLSRGLRHRATVAACVIAKSRETEQYLRAEGSSRVVLYPEAGADPSEVDISVRARNVQENALVVVSVGRLLAWKGYHLAMDAIGRCIADGIDVSYVVIGTGPERGSLGRQAAALGIADQVRFLGWVERAAVADQLRASDVFIHPSLHDSGGWACIEAMSAGLPVVCLDLGGPAVTVPRDAGIHIGAVALQDCIGDLTRALATLAHNPTSRQEMGRRGAQHVLSHLLWETKGDFLSEMYHRVVREVPRCVRSGQVSRSLSCADSNSQPTCPEYGITGADTQ